MSRVSLFLFGIGACALFCLPVPSFGAWQGCESQVNRLLDSPREQFVLATNAQLYDQYDLGDCSEDLEIALMIAIHEGVHFIDLNINGSITSDIDSDKINLYMTDMSRLVPPLIELPSPYEMFEVHGLSWDKLQEAKKSEIFLSDYRAYILDKDMLSSNVATYGLGTEYNAYGHGALTGLSLLPLTKEFETKIIGPLVAQRSGVIFYTGLLSVYFEILKKKFPSLWESLIANDSATNFYRKLLSQGFEVLKATSHCDSLTPYEIEYTRVAGTLLNDEIFQDLKVSYTKVDFEKFAICR